MTDITFEILSVAEDHKIPSYEVDKYVSFASDLMNVLIEKGLIKKIIVDGEESNECI